MNVHLALLASVLLLNCDAKPRGDRDQRLFPQGGGNGQIVKPLEDQHVNEDDEDLKQLENEYVYVEDGKVNIVKILI